MRPRQETTVGTDLHLPCTCGHTWTAHLPLAGATLGRCTVDCLDGCTEYTPAKDTRGAGHVSDWNPTNDIASGCACCGLPPGECCEVNYDDDHPDTVFGAEPGTRYGQ